MNKPLCFILMPFGRKPDISGKLIDFDSVYSKLIAPSIVSAGLEPIRADEEKTGGIIHKPMFERLILCDYAVADLTTANANVFYELGVRHAIRPATTVLLFAEGRGQLPFDVRSLRAFPYQLDDDGRPVRVDADRVSLTARLREARKPSVDSPIYQLVEGYPVPDIQHLKTDSFRDRVAYSNEVKRKLAEARRTGVQAIRAIETEILPIQDVEAGVVLDLFLSYRSVEAWNDMIRLVEIMAPPLSNTVMVKEQLAFALNRSGRGEEAEKTLIDLLAQKGSSSETYGLLGRIYKDRWQEAEKSESKVLARGLLNKAIDVYLKGFEADSRDFYPGINAVTLMEIRDPPDPRRLHLNPVVAYAVEQRIATGKADYWDYTTRLELAVLAKDEAVVMEALSAALATQPEPWERKTTANNLRLIREARERRNEQVPWAVDIENELIREISR